MAAGPEVGPLLTTARHELRGLICSAGFASGDRIVVGHWRSGPLGPMNDVMWARPDGTRVLIAPTQTVADYISAIYRFDAVEIHPVSVSVRGRDQTIGVTAGPLRLTLTGGVFVPFPPRWLRPPWFVATIENAIARMSMGLRTYGVTPRGIREWYRVDGLRFVRSGDASLDGRSLDALAPIDPPMAMGVSDPPARPSIVRVRPLLVDPTGYLDTFVTPR